MTQFRSIVSSTPSSPSTSSVSSASSPKAPQRIPRPLNSFMIFRLEKQHEIAKLCPGANHRDISKIISKWWRKLDDEGKSVYIKRAELSKKEHKRLYPDYKFTPHKRTKCKRVYKKKSNEAPEVRDLEGKKRILSLLNGNDISSLNDSPELPLAEEAVPIATEVADTKDEEVSALIDCLSTADPLCMENSPTDFASSSSTPESYMDTSFSGASPASSEDLLHNSLHNNAGNLISPLYDYSMVPSMSVNTCTISPSVFATLNFSERSNLYASPASSDYSLGLLIADYQLSTMTMNNYIQPHTSFQTVEPMVPSDISLYDSTVFEASAPVVNPLAYYLPFPLAAAPQQMLSASNIGSLDKFNYSAQLLAQPFYYPF